MPRKKPKPRGQGHYAICGKCRGFGAIYETKMARPSGVKRTQQARSGSICKDCHGTGWVDAQR